MTDFSFDRAQLDSLDGDDKTDASAAADTAEILAGYYQQVAKAIVDRAGGMPPAPAFSPGQRKLARETQIIMTGTAQGTTAGRAATKIFMATQMDFYRQNPQYLAAFVGRPADLFDLVEQLHDALPETYEPVDRYFEDSFRQLQSFAAAYLQNPPGPSPSPS